MQKNEITKEMTTQATPSEFCSSVYLELTEMKKVGVKVPAKALKMAHDPSTDEYSNMRVSDCADLILNLC
jgi:hypothetical protein